MLLSVTEVTTNSNDTASEGEEHLASGDREGGPALDRVSDNTLDASASDSELTKRIEQLTGEVVAKLESWPSDSSDKEDGFKSLKSWPELPLLPGLSFDSASQNNLETPIGKTSEIAATESDMEKCENKKSEKTEGGELNSEDKDKVVSPEGREGGTVSGGPSSPPPVKSSVTKSDVANTTVGATAASTTTTGTTVATITTTGATAAIISTTGTTAITTTTNTARRTSNILSLPLPIIDDDSQDAGTDDDAMDISPTTSPSKTNGDREAKVNVNQSPENVEEEETVDEQVMTLSFLIVVYILMNR